MKKKFSTAWNSSVQARKQRKYRANAPIHIRQKLLSAHLSTALKTRYGRRSIGLRVGDNVKVMKGEFKGRTGKISVSQPQRLRVAIEGLQRTKKDGTKVNIFFSPSNIQINELNLDDKERVKALERTKIGKAGEKQEEKKEEKKTEEQKELKKEDKGKEKK